MIINASSSVSGIKTAIDRMVISAHDIANINTAGFQQNNVNQAETHGSGTYISHRTKDTNSIELHSTTDSATEAVEQIVGSTTIRANSSVLKVQNRMLGALLNIVG